MYKRQLHGREEKVNPKLTAYQVELAQVEAEIEKLLDTLTGANATLLSYANKKDVYKRQYRNYGEWQKDRKGPLSYQDRLRLAIDTALAERPADLDEFLNLMKRADVYKRQVHGVRYRPEIQLHLEAAGLPAGGWFSFQPSAGP